MYRVELRSEPGLTTAALPHKGAYAEIGHVFDRAARMPAAAGIKAGP